MKFFVTGVGGQLGHDVMNELLKRGHEGVGSDIQENYSGVADGSAVTKAPYPNDEGGMAWNDPEIGIEWPELKGEYKGSASAEGYTLKDGTALNLSDKDQKWLGLKDTFKF